MRIAPFALPLVPVLLSACGGPETSQGNNAQANISTIALAATRTPARATNSMVMLAAAPATTAQRSCTSATRAWKAIGKAMKALHRELDRGKPDIAVVRAPTRRWHRRRAKIPGWFPAGTGPEVGKTGAKPEIWQAARTDFVRQARRTSRSPHRRSMPPPVRRRQRDQGALRRPRQGLQGLPRQVSAREMHH